MSNEDVNFAADLEILQRETFDYFLHETNPANGLVIDRTEANWPASIAATCFALATYPVAVERGFLPRSDATEIVRFALNHCIHQAKLTQFNSYGFKASFNPTHPESPAACAAPVLTEVGYEKV